MICKAVKTFFTIVGLIVKLSTATVKPNRSLESFPSTRQTSVIVNFNCPVISYYLLRSLCFSIVLRTNGRIFQSRTWLLSNIDSEVGSSADLCVKRSGIGKMKFMLSRINSPESTTSRRDMFLSVSVVKVLLKKLKTSNSNNSLIPTHF